MCGASSHCHRPWEGFNCPPSEPRSVTGNFCLFRTKLLVTLRGFYFILTYFTCSVKGYFEGLAHPPNSLACRLHHTSTVHFTHFCCLGSRRWGPAGGCAGCAVAAELAAARHRSKLFVWFVSRLFPPPPQSHTTVGHHSCFAEQMRNCTQRRIANELTRALSSQ